MARVIDAQTHYMPPAVAEKTAFFKVNWSDIERQLRIMDENEIEMAILLYPTSDAHVQMGGWDPLCQIYNRDIANVVKKYQGRFIGAGILPIDQQNLIEGELRRILEYGLRMLSLASSYDGKYLDDDIFLPVFSFAQKHKIPIHVHPQTVNPIGEERVKDPLLSPVLEYVFDVSMCIGRLMMKKIFLNFPDVKFIFAHYGGVLPFVKERFDSTYLMLRQRGFVEDLSRLPSEYFENLYFDTSGSKSLASLMCALEITDPSHVLFGSDFPANTNLAESIAVIKKAAITEKQKADILSNNVRDLFC